MQNPLTKKMALTIFVAGIFAINPVFADKPEWKEKGGPGNGQEIQKQKIKPQAKDTQKIRTGDPQNGRTREVQNVRTNDLQKRHTTDPRITIYFGDHHRDVIRQYYSDSYHSGHCPPGLAKKNNGCQPPGLAKKWQLGRPLPRDVIYYDLPPQVVISLGVPPAGHKFVRVASDILLIAIGTGLVIDAIQDLNNL